MPSKLPSLLAALATFLLLGIVLRVGMDAATDATGDGVVHASLGADSGADPPETGRAEGENPALAIDPTTCARAAYLCAGLLERGQSVVARWEDGITVLRVLVLPPAHEETGPARRLQEAAVRGVRAWHGQPFPLRVTTVRGDAEPHVTVAWNPRLEGTELGHVRTRWRTDEGASNGQANFSVEAFVLATRHPMRPDAVLEAGEVELAAAHEMGHALGLPHSPDSTDLMYPTNTARRLSVDDFRAVEALYRMPPGARLPQGRRPEG